MFLLSDAGIFLVFYFCQLWADGCKCSCSMLAVHSTVADHSLILLVHLHFSAHRLFSQVFVFIFHLQVLLPVP